MFLRHNRKGFASLGVSTVCLLAYLLPVKAQDRSNPAQGFPDRTVRIVVPLPAGGPTDINVRIIAQKLNERWGQAVIVENRPGGNTGIGAQLVAKSPADGYTLLAAQDTTMVMNPASGASLTYDPFKDYAPITLLNRNVSLLGVRAANGPKSVKELIAYGRANSGKINYGAGIITARLAAYRFTKVSGFNATLIPYKGSAEVVQGLMTGSVDFIVDGLAASLPLIKSGQLRALAKLNNQPVTALPDLKPLASEAGLPELGEMSTWVGLLAPAGTPPTIIDKIQRDVVAVYSDPEVRERLDRSGISPVTTTPSEFDRFFRDEAAKWTKVFQESGLKIQ